MGLALAAVALLALPVIARLGSPKGRRYDDESGGCFLLILPAVGAALGFVAVVVGGLAVGDAWGIALLAWALAMGVAYLGGDDLIWLATRERTPFRPIAETLAVFAWPIVTPLAICLWFGSVTTSR
jgi:hypothetical protein